MKFTIPVPLLNKANRYRIVKIGGRYSLARDKKTCKAETDIAWIVRDRIPEILEGELELYLTIYGRLDIDGVKSALDGIQQSGRIHNDAQFVRLVVERLEGKNDKFDVEIKEVVNDA